MTTNQLEIPSTSAMLSGLGAIGVALQNYPAVELFIVGQEIQTTKGW